MIIDITKELSSSQLDFIRNNIIGAYYAQEIGRRCTSNFLQGLIYKHRHLCSHIQMTHPHKIPNISGKAMLRASRHVDNYIAVKDLEKEDKYTLFFRLKKDREHFRILSNLVITSDEALVLVRERGWWQNDFLTINCSLLDISTKQEWYEEFFSNHSIEQMLKTVKPIIKKDIRFVLNDNSHLPTFSFCLESKKDALTLRMYSE